ncbi:MAG: phosphotransferase [Oscillospiraceae bacterium]|jgi:Ser/Thr protein kinase RdoA (MazF antagonist)|nr:phosphotransferase [Oscillospiraceae bacterium]
MLHASDFTWQGLCGFLRREYALEPASASPIPRGSACLYLADCGDGKRFVVKEYQRGYDPRGVRQEARLCAFLRERGIPTARFAPTRAGETACTHKGRLVTVQEYAEGEAPENHSAAPWLMERSARLLGELHRALRDFPPMREEFSRAWAAPARIPAKRKEYEALLKKAERLEEPRAARIAEDLRFKLAGLDWLAAQPDVTQGLTYANTHGDYSIGQLLIGGEKIVAVLDFAGACRLPAAWEVIRSYSLADPACAGGALPQEGLGAYLDAYEAVFPLAAADRQNMRRFYAAQLLRSSYGYRQFFDPAVDGREEALRFGFWRTELVRTLLADG